jgi:hypothetical protein
LILFRRSGPPVSLWKRDRLFLGISLLVLRRAMRMSPHLAFSLAMVQRREQPGP